VSDDELTPRQRAMGWTTELVNSYVEQRNQAATKRILGRVGNINPLTGKPRRREIFEGPAYGNWNPQNFWRRDRGCSPRRDWWKSGSEF
jgi:hypothetical protein